MPKAKKKVATKVVCKRVQKNPYMTDDGWKADHWRCTLSRRGKRMSVYYSKGVGYKGRPPTSGEIMESMALDASGIENARGFDDWADEYGLDADSRKAYRSYQATKANTARLRKFLGEALYDRLVYGKR